MRSPRGPITDVCSDWYMFGLGSAMKSLKRPGIGVHLRVHDAERRVAVAHGLDEHAEGDDVEELLEVAPGLHHLLVDRPQVLGPPVDLHWMPFSASSSLSTCETSSM